MPVSLTIEGDIQADLAAILQAVSITGIDTGNVGKIREAPTVTEVIDPLPCVLICSRGPHKTEPLSFEGAASRVYVEEIIVIAGREGDFQSDQVPTQSWLRQYFEAVDREQSGANAGQFRTTLPDCPSVYAIEVGDIATFDRTKLGDSYAYLSFFVTVRSSE